MTKRRRYVWFAATTVVLTVLLSVAALFAVDYYLHKKYERVGGWNLWGYRGPAVGDKQPGATRIAVLGGSTALGYGVAWEASFPRLLEQRLREGGTGQFDIVNLAMNRYGAHSFIYTLVDYEHLDYDVVILYEGYNDLRPAPNLTVTRRQSPVFRMTGYLPLLPILIQEKAMALRYGGDIAAAYRNEKAVFQATIVDRSSAAALAAAVNISHAFDRQLAEFANEPPPMSAQPGGQCGARWNHYCDSVARAIDYALGKNKRTLVVSQPKRGNLHAEQQRALLHMLQQRYSHDPRVRHVDLSATVDVRDPALSYDSVHLTLRGNDMIAAALVQPVREIATRGAP